MKSLIRHPASLILAMLFLALGVSFCSDFVIDDTYITFRYSRNLANGLGPVFHAGDRVEGYTNFLWMLLMSVAFPLGINPLFWSRGLSLLATLGMLGVVGDWANRIRSGGDEAHRVLPILCAFVALPLWGMSGMETSLFTFLVTWGIYRAVMNLGYAEIPLFLAAACRPEGLWFLAVGWLARLVSGGRRPGPILASGLGYMGLLALRYGYYGDLVPNTFHAKVGMTLAQVWRGVGYLLNSSWCTLGHGILLGALFAVILDRRRWVHLTGLATGVYLGYVVIVGGDASPLHRFILPVFPLILILFWTGIIRLETHARTPERLRIALASPYLSYALAGGLFLTSTLPVQDQVAQDAKFTREFIILGKWLKTWTDPKWTIAVDSAGAIPYFSELKTLDVMGLVDRTVARSRTQNIGTGVSGHERSNADYVLKTRPDLIFLNVILSTAPPIDLRQLDSSRVFGETYRYPAIIDIWNHPLFREEYRQGHIQLEGQSYVLFYLRESQALKRARETGVQFVGESSPPRIEG